jgi:hypothetical protein
MILRWPDPQRAAGAAAPLIRWERNARNLGPARFKPQGIEALWPTST